MGKKDISAVVFDCDGVLIESNALKTRAFGKTVSEYGQGAMDRLMAYHTQNGGVSRFKKFEWFFSEVIRQPLPDGKMQKLCDRFRQHSFEAVVSAPLVKGAQEVLDMLYTKLPLFVASGTPQPELVDVLEANGLARYFDYIAGTPPEKSALLQNIIDTYRLDPSAVLMVGDSLTDLQAARDCSTLFYGRGEQFSPLGVPWGEDLTGLARWIAGH
jgi:phosphoglycolate phosphatase-like HAD superfamily hydrolase